MDIIGGITIVGYVILALLNVGAAAQHRKALFSITKPLLMLVLVGLYLANSSSPHISVVLALFFAWWGDVSLMGDINSMKSGFSSVRRKARCRLAWGGLSFLLGHLFYIGTFFHLRNPHYEWLIYVLIFLAYIIIGILLNTVLIRDLPGLGKLMEFGAKVYAAVLLLMSFSSTLIISPPHLFTWLPFMGSLFFIMSDLLLADEHKSSRAINYRPWVMGTYTTAQFLIVIGLALL